MGSGSEKYVVLQKKRGEVGGSGFGEADSTELGT